MHTEYLTSCSSAGLHKIAFQQWGDKKNPNVLVCAHGLTRQKHDFDDLAKRLSQHYRVLSFDFPGRGESDWLQNKSSYDFAQYIVDALIVVAYSNQNKVHWLGTSMGGILGMLLASMDNSPINKLIINDVGPFIPKTALSRIADYLSQPVEFDNEEQFELYLRTIHASFGALTDDQWKRLTRYSQRKLTNGKITLHYDPGIALPYASNATQDVDLWPVWHAITQQCLLIHGEQSDLLSAETAQQMTKTGPKSELLTIPNTGHAPALMNDNDIDYIHRWLSK